MAYCTLNGRRVLRGSLTLPRIGVWHGDFVVDSSGPLEGPVVIAFGDGAVVFKGTIVRGDVFQNTFSCRIVGGAAGLGSILAAKYYRGAPIQLALQDLIADCGEGLSPSCDAATLARVLIKWCRNKGPAARALSDLVDPTDAIWRVLADGTVYVGPESWPDLAFAHDVIARNPADGRLVIASELPLLRPGVVFGREKISAVTHSIAPERVRTEAWTERGSLLDRLKGPLSALIRSVMRQVDYHRPYPARVIQQESDLTLHLRPDSDEIPGLTGVPIRYGIPGVTAKVPPGARCLVEFENGDPGAPIVTAFEPGALVELSFDGGKSPVARVGDSTRDGSLRIDLVDVPPPGTGKILTFTYVRPDGTPGGTPLAITLAPTAFVAAVPPTGTSFDLAGVIDAGAPRVRA